MIQLERVAATDDIKRCESATKTPFELYRKLKYRQYEECSHIWVCDKAGFNEITGCTYARFGCMKCGLDYSALDKGRTFSNFNELIMCDYIEKYGKQINHKHVYTGLTSQVICDLSLAVSIYSRIKKRHPEIDDDTALKYFEIALHDIRNIPVNNTRTQSRIKRLSLSRDFAGWNEYICLR